MTLALRITLTTLIGSVVLGVVACHFWTESARGWSEKFFGVLLELFYLIALVSFAGIFVILIWDVGR